MSRGGNSTEENYENTWVFILRKEIFEGDWLYENRGEIDDVMVEMSGHTESGLTAK